MANLNFQEIIDSVDHEKDNAFTSLDYLRVSFWSNDECLIGLLVYSDGTFTKDASQGVESGHTISDLEALVRAHDLIKKFELTER